RQSLITIEPAGNDPTLLAVVCPRRRRHIDNSSDQLGPGSFWHRFVALVERGLVEVLAGHQRGERFRQPSAFDRAHGFALIQIGRLALTGAQTGTLSRLAHLAGFTRFPSSARARPPSIWLCPVGRESSRRGSFPCERSRE